MLGSRSIWHEGWKAVTTHPVIAGWGHYNDDTWELYHTDVDRAELNDLAAEQPDKLRELVNIWFSEAGANAAFPLDDRSPVEIFATPRPQLSAPRDRYVYLPDAAPVPEWQAVNVKNRSFVIGALIDIPAPGAEGVLFATERASAGTPCTSRTTACTTSTAIVGAEEQIDRRIRGRPDGRRPDPVGVVREGGLRTRSPAPERCRSTTATRRSARRRSRPSSERSRSRAQVSTWDAMRASRSPSDYPGAPPYAFIGGTIHQVSVNVSGEPYLDLERHAQMMLKAQ